MVISCDMGEAVYDQPNVRHEILNVTDRPAIKEFVAK